MYQGALHVVQTRDSPAAPQANLGIPNPGPPPLNDIMFLEYHARGDFHKVLGTLARRAEDRKANPPAGPQPPLIPDRILWLMFQCCKFALAPVRDLPCQELYLIKY